jgi:hypothetical protein
MQLPKKFKKFIEEQNWIFAKTYAETWPHEYIVQQSIDNNLFLALANHIDKFGYQDNFYEMKLIYFNYNGFTYWHMENIINRCNENETYQKRKEEKRLPED